jgi:hypothetical protein
MLREGSYHHRLFQEKTGKKVSKVWNHPKMMSFSEKDIYSLLLQRISRISGSWWESLRYFYANLWDETNR